MRLIEQTSTTIRLEWSPPSFENRNGIIRSYIVRLHSINETILMTQNFTTQTTSIEIQGLIPNTDYVFQVAAITVSEGPFLRNGLIFRTLQDGEH